MSKKVPVNPYSLDISDATWKRLGTSEKSVEVAHLEEGCVAMRYAHDPDTVLRYTKREWAAFVAGSKQGEFDLAAPQ